ncbi:hypothetical protein E1263_20880 [Kribbella antibiotica]|uniref:Uncharacterized protein n=1 Tax=Kribbella antibiotica TaxID=190195 RepID=A0A4R4ZJQ3_9ACTN|nr:type II toxin-antitoxin system VapC family toxin [Kribbella antibiotica]TDD58014.1 hypothetical protein E1263_20880 [Kribbella antibiotica]
MRLILDTNLWSDIGDEAVAPEFDDLVRQRGLEILVPPSILVEVCRLSVPELRDPIIRALAIGPRRRLATEAESESAELVAEVRRLRPAWMRKTPDTAKVHSLNAFWTKKVWRTALADSQRIYNYEVGSRRLHEDLMKDQKDQRKQLLETNFAMRPLTALEVREGTAGFGREAEGWPSEPVEAWRMSCYELFWHQLVTIAGRSVLTKEDATFADWVGAYVDLRALRHARSDFLRFWAYEVDLASMPRNWIRWAVNLLQATEKVTGGNPSDEQHSSYLVDADYFLTADRRYAAILEAVREDAPFEMAKTIVVAGDRERSVLGRICLALGTVDSGDTGHVVDC